MNLVDCVWKEWSVWPDESECIGNCGIGKYSRSRNIHVNASHGGSECTGESVEVRNCTIPDKPCPGREFVSFNYVICQKKYVCQARILEPCGVSKWYDKGECSASCGGGYQKRVRDILVQAQEGGIPCPEDLEIPIHCNLDICENGTGK